MDKQQQREERIFSKLNLEKLPFKLKQENFKVLGNAVSLTFHEIYNSQVKSHQLRWVFSTVKRFKIFLEIFYFLYKILYFSHLTMKTRNYLLISS